MPRFDKSLIWFRRDLRSFDHAALYHALKQSRAVYCVFVFDKDILDSLPRTDHRIEFIHASVLELDNALREWGGNLIVRHAHACEAIPALAAELNADAVFANHDYEPQAIERDAAVAARLKASGRALITFKDQVIFEKDEVLSQSQKPFSVFTPYHNAWLKKLQACADDSASPIAPYRIDECISRLLPYSGNHIPTLDELGFEKTNLDVLGIEAGMHGGQALIDDFAKRIGQYDQTRDFPVILKARHIYPCICASARYRSAAWCGVRST